MSICQSSGAHRRRSRTGTQDRDELAVIRYLGETANPPSPSCVIHREWSLTRENIKRALHSLSYDRMLQVAFATVIGATRFKLLEGRNLAEVKCPNCGQKDSWEHCKTCYQIQAPRAKTEKAWIAEIDCAMNILRTPNPALNEKADGAKEGDKQEKRQKVAGNIPPSRKPKKQGGR